VSKSSNTPGGRRGRGAGLSGNDGESNDPFGSYVRSLRSTNIREKTEHTDRDAIKRLLQNFTPSGITIVPEPKRISGVGAPDFKVRQNGQIVGYVEAKPLGTTLEELKKVLKSDQITRYRSISKNIIVTDYLNWIWLKDGNVQTGTLCNVKKIEDRRGTLESTDTAKVQSLLSGFLSVPPQQVDRSIDLADELATRTRLLRDFLGLELVRQQRTSQGERLFGLYLAFKKQVSDEITLSEFADAFAQTLSYGLFLSKLNANGHSLRLENANQYIPKSFRLIEELVGFLDELNDDYYKDIKWVVDEVLSIINGLNVLSIKEDLSFRNRKGSSRSLKAKDEEEWRLFSRDPFIYFYEDFLSKYDSKLRKSRGVYYTPPPVVNFIVRGTDDILKDQFNLKAGLADHKRVTVLEFACGTGTFIVEIIQRIIDNLQSSPGKIDLALKEHVLKNIFAFEYLIAPYTIAHLKLSQYFEDRQIKIGDKQRFNIFLTNTLEPLEPQQNFLLPALSEETKNATAVKNSPILVITGNPPYAGESKNKGQWITSAIEDYKFTHEKGQHGKLIRTPVKERNLKWLHDDYVKFIRFAQMKIDKANEGVVSIITNHSFLDNPTFPGMRDSLMRTFDQIWIVDLHGSTKPKESAPDGDANENVFDIKKGVAISFLVKKPGAERGVWRADVWGTRIEKYKFLSHANLSDLEWEKLSPKTPDYLFVPQNHDLNEEYQKGFPVTEIFPVNGTGIITKRDHLCIHFTAADVWKTVTDFVKTPDPKMQEHFDLPEDVRDWKIKWAKEDLVKSGPSRSLVTPLMYRPFDTRYTYYTGRARGFIGWPVDRLMRHMLKPNIALVTSRLTKGEDFAHVQVTDKPTEVICMSPETSNNGFLFPMYLYAPELGEELSLPDLFGKEDVFDGNARIENISPSFRAWINSRYGKAYPIQKIFGYVFAVLHSRTYRTKYAEFLRRGFPRIKFPETALQFEVLSGLGHGLAQAHLLKNVPNEGLAKYIGDGDHKVSDLRYVAEERAVYINESQSFAPVPADVWKVYVGGYQVLEKYLKSRKGRALNLDEIDNFTNVANVMAFTLSQMNLIDKAYTESF
jgi:hypothetical protein